LLGQLPGTIAVACGVGLAEEQIASSIRYLAREHGQVAEGAGAAPIAAILAGKIPISGQTVAIISGRNIATQTPAEVLLNT
jgi:threonine dehydratase